MFLTEKKLFLSTQTKFFKVQKSQFSKKVNPCFWSKIVNFSLFGFGRNKTRKNA